MVETIEREMVRKTEEKSAKDEFTSLQPTYEDTVPPHLEDDWEYED